MLMMLRQITAIVILPVTVTILIPLAVIRPGNETFEAGRAADLILLIAGTVFLGAGIALFAWCVMLFWRRGRGTLAPWDPPRRLVADGPYRHVRNPMITGVILVLIGETLLMRSPPLARWTVLFVVINAVYIPLLEEPMLRDRFGESYTRYAKAVPRFLPRLRPWTPAE